MANIIEGIWRSAQLHGDREAIVAPDGRYTYRELAHLVRGIQASLEARGPVPDRVGVLTGDSVYCYAAILAVLASGSAYVPISASYPERRMLEVIERAGVAVVITHSGRDAIFSNVDGQTLPHLIHAPSCEPSEEPWNIGAAGDDALAYILFTSGSTGRPKGVPITHGNLHAFVGATFGAHGCYSVEPGDRFLQMFELTFDLSVMCFLVPLMNGATACIVPQHGVGFMNVVKTLADEKITVSLMVPSVLSYLQRFMPELVFPDVRLSLFCGEGLPYDLLRLWCACVPNAVIENTYGPTEATIFCSRFPIATNASSLDVHQGVVSIGRALAGSRLLVLGERGNLLSNGERGELCIAGAQVMGGYWQDGAKTAEAMSSVRLANGSEVTVYRTGDIVFENEHGNLMFCGRKDSQVKIDGHRVELGEIEHRAREFLGHGLVAVLLMDGPEGNKQLVLFAEGVYKPESDGLQAYLRERLPAYMHPARIESLARMPLNSNGKIDRPAIRRSFDKLARAS